MKLQNKRHIQSMLFLFNEKVCFRSRYDNCSSIFMRFDLNIVFYSNINLIYFFFLSFPFLSNDISVFRNNSRYSVSFKLHSHYLYEMMSFFFFSFFYTYFSSGSNFFYFWFKRYKYFNIYNNSVGISHASKIISPFSFFDDYFYGILDADHYYRLQFSYQSYYYFVNVFFLRLFSSLLCFPFVNKRKRVF